MWLRAYCETNLITAAVFIYSQLHTNDIGQTVKVTFTVNPITGRETDLDALSLLSLTKLGGDSLQAETAPQV